MQSMFLSHLPDSIGLVAGKESPTRARVPVCAWLAALVAWPWLAGVLHAGIAIRLLGTQKSNGAYFSKLGFVFQSRPRGHVFMGHPVHLYSGPPPPTTPQGGFDGCLSV